MNHSTPGLPVHHQLSEFTQTHVHGVSDAIQPSHPLSCPSPLAPNPSHVRLFSNESTLCTRWPKYWSFSFIIIPSKEIPGLISFRTRTTALSNSMKLSHAHGATQDGRVMVERSDRMWSTGEGNGKPLQYCCLENPMNSMKRQNDRILKEELPR